MSTEALSKPPLLVRLRKAFVRLLATPFIGIWRLLGWMLGPRPGAYSMILLWIALALGVRSVTSIVLSSVTNLSDTPSTPIVIVNYIWFALSLAIVAACVNWITTRETPLPRSKVIGALVLALLAVVCVNLLDSQTLSVPALFGVKIPTEVYGSLHGSWLSFAMFAIIGLLIECRWKLPLAWRLIAVGTFGGYLMAYILAYPVITTVYHTFVPGDLLGGPGSSQVNVVSIGLALLIGLALAPLAVLWTAPSTNREKMMRGAIVGGLAGIFLFLSLGSPSAGIIGGQPLYGVVQSHVGFGTAEWLLKLGQSINLSLLLDVLAFWLLLVVGIGLGALMAYFTGARTRLSTSDSGSRLPSTLLVMLLASIGIALGASSQTTFLGFMGSAFLRTESRFGFATSGLSLWLSVVVNYNSWLLALIPQAIALALLFRYKSPAYRRTVAIAACLNGILNLLIGLPVAASTVLGWINLVIALETFIIGVRLYRTSRRDDPARAGVWGWVNVGITSFVIGLIAANVAFSAELNLALIQIVLMVPLGDGGKPPVGLPWLRDQLTAVYTASAATANWLIPTLVYFGIPVLIVAILVLGTPASVRIAFIAAIWKRILRVGKWIYRLIALRKARPWLRWVLWLALAALLDFADYVFYSHPPVLTMLVLLFLASRVKVERVPFALVGLAYLIALTDVLFIGLSVHFDTTGGAIIAFFAIVAAFVVYRTLMAYGPERWRWLVRVSAILGVAFILTAFAYLNQPTLDIRGGVSRYDGQRWEVLSPSNSSLGSQIGYRISPDSHNNLWFSGNSGVVVKYDGTQWTTYLGGGSTFPSDFGTDNSWDWTSTANPQNWTNVNIPVAESGSNRLVTARAAALQDDNFADGLSSEQAYQTIVHHLTITQANSTQRTAIGKAMYCSEPTETNYAGKPNNPWDRTVPLIPPTPGEGQPTPTPPLLDPHTEQAVLFCHLTLKNPVTGLARDQQGWIWVATAGDGVIHYDANRDVSDTTWIVYTTGSSQLPSDTITALYVDKSNTAWFATDHGLSQFDGTAWKTMPLPDADKDGATALFKDQTGGLWAGSASGAQRFDGQAWNPVVKDASVTAFAQTTNGYVWIGTKTGLIRFDPQDNSLATFNAQDSGMATDRVYDLYADPQGNLWVSTFSATPGSRSTIPAVLLSLIFFGGLFALNYQWYRRAPQTRARQLGQQFTRDPNSLYPQAYQLLSGDGAGQAVLARLPDVVSTTGDPSGAASLSALARIAQPLPTDEIPAALEATSSAFEQDTRREWAESLRGLYALLLAALSVSRVADLTGLELTVNPGQAAGRIALNAKGHPVGELPPFLPTGTAEAWHALEKVGSVLRKYQAVDNTGDQLSYLADTLSSAEAAQHAAEGVAAPEGPILQAIANRWRTLVVNEINFISGRAELRLELRTRQARRSSEVQLAFRLQNTGRAAAENVIITLDEPGKNADSEVDHENQLYLERLASGQSAPLEFKISPSAMDTLRVKCSVTWTDRSAENHAIEFADVIHFYDVAEEFQRIPNPYIVGHPVKGTEMFFGREDIFRFIEENLTGVVQDRTIVLYGQRRTGKTSILYQLLGGRLGENFVPVLLDMQELASLTESTGDFLGEMAYQIGRAANKAGISLEVPEIETFAVSPTRAFSRFLDSLEEILGQRRIIIMFDEFELIQSKIAANKLEADVLGYLRSLIQHRSGLVFIFTGTHRLQEMSHDYWAILFNIALHRQVSFLTPADATALIRKPVMGVLDVDELAVEKIYNLTSGHAFFVQLLCWAVVNECNAKAHNYATINDVNDALQQMLTTGESHFAYIWQTATYQERLALSGLAQSIRPGKPWAQPAEIMENLVANGDARTQSADLLKTLDHLVAQEVLEVAREGVLRYRFQLEVLRLWVAANKSVAALIEHGDY